MECADLKNDVNQLALLLFSPELLNEKFLIKIRDCVVKLADKHPLKKWLKWMSQSRRVEDNLKDQYSFLVEIVSSPFNLITDGAMKRRISGYLIGMPEETLPELFLKSYLYLMIGNVTRSDNLLKKIILTPPRFNWGRKQGASLEHRIGKEQIRQIFQKLAHHPADRTVFQLVALYIQSYYNENLILELADDVDTKDLEAKLYLKSVEVIAPELVKFIRASSLKMEKRMSELKASQFPLKEQAYWIWPFLEMTPLSSSDLSAILAALEKEDHLWNIYLISEETISETLAKQSINHFLPRHRGDLKAMLDRSEDFMLALYKLIELGDISSEIIEKTIMHIANE